MNTYPHINTINKERKTTAASVTFYYESTRRVKGDGCTSSIIR